MSKFRRILLVVIAAVVAVGGFALLRPGEAEEPPRNSAATQAAAESSTTTPKARSRGEESTSAPAEPAPRRVRPRSTAIRVRAGRPVGGVKRIRVKSGRTVRLAVTADAPEEIHVHGYDIEEELTAGRAANLRFPAELEGIFEIELHGSGELLAELEVRP